MDFTSENFKRKIEPFKFFTDEEQYTLWLNTAEDGYLADLFRTREDEGFIGNGYDWEALAEIFLAEIYEGEDDSFDFDSEAGAFVVYSEDGKSLSEFALAFKEACEDADLIADLFTRAEIR